MQRFKIEYIRPGVQHTPCYANRVQAAVKTARKHGFSVSHSTTEMRPHSAKIYERIGGEGRHTQWELIATVTEDNIRTEDHDSRPSIQAKRAKLASLQVEIDDAYSTQLRLCRIADEEYQATGK